MSQVSREGVSFPANSEPMDDSFPSSTSAHSPQVDHGDASLEYASLNLFHYDIAEALDAAYEAPTFEQNTDIATLSQFLMQDETDRQDEASFAVIQRIMREDMESLEGSNRGDTKPAFDRDCSNSAKRFTTEMVHELYRLCILTKPDDNSYVTDAELWEPVRSYMLSDSELVKCATNIRNQGGLTPFHQVCRHNPPLDIIELFVACAGVDVVKTTDNAGMLPLHLACVHPTSVEVVDALVTVYPEGRVIQDTKGATPLHYAVTNIKCSNAVISKVCVEGAAAAADNHGMMPIHYTTTRKAYFRPVTVEVLMNAYPWGLSSPDEKGRTPIRWLAKSCNHTETLELLQIAVVLDPSLAKGEMGLSLLSILGECARNVGRSDNIQSFLNLLLEHNPEPSERYFALLKSLPRWVQSKVPEEKPRFVKMLSRRSLFRRANKNPSDKGR